MTGHAACNLMPVVAANRIGTEEVVPVSYTHLDVYKRQVYDLLRDEYDIQIEFGDICNILAYISIGDRIQDKMCIRDSCIALGAGVGAGVLVSRYFGARDYGKMKTIVSTSLISFRVLSVLLGVFGFFFAHSMMSLLQTPADILDEAVL